MSDSPVWKCPLDVQQIRKIIPHRYPFLFIDRVLELDPGKSIKAKPAGFMVTAAATKSSVIASKAARARASRDAVSPSRPGAKRSSDNNASA